MPVGIIYHPIYLQHDTGPHPERAERLTALMDAVEKTDVRDLTVRLEPRPATIEEITAVHTAQHVTEVRGVASQGGGYLDLDTVVSARSYDAALMAAGGAIVGAEAVVKGEAGYTFAFVRPPGHHAGRQYGAGFCLFNNVAIAARYVQNNLDIQRVLIVDFDVHHGNGTQDVFYDDSSVLYFSTHQTPLYPGSGRVEETGRGAGEGYTINVPLPPGAGDSTYTQAFEEVLVPAARRFQPQVILVSAGYDAHWTDDIASMKLSVAGYAALARCLKQLADDLCDGRLAFVLEGGYNLRALAASAVATLRVLSGQQPEDPLGPPRPAPEPDVAPILRRVRQLHHLT